MGFDLYAYMGPAISVNKQARPVATNINSCSNYDCPNSKSAQRTNFCAECGSPVLSRTIKVMREVSLNDFVYDESGRFEKWEDYLSDRTEFDKENVWIPNRGPKEMYTFHGEAVDKTILLKEIHEVERQIIAFNAFFADMFEDMREYGLDFETVYVCKLYSI